MEIIYPDMILNKSEGATESERYLIKKCQNTFLSLWSYPNPYTEEKKGKELCDVIAIFGKHVFVFSDKLCVFDKEEKVEIAWNRWFKHAVRAGAYQLIRAERYLKSGRPVYLDSKRTQHLPLSIPAEEDMIIHRIVVARGIKESCIEYFGGGSGSLIMNTTFVGDQHLCSIDQNGEPIDAENVPLFRTGLIVDRSHYIHVFDDCTLDCIMDELDTVSDFINYLEQKERLILSGKDIIASGEEEILGRYLTIIENEKHCIVTEEENVHNKLFCFDGFWQQYLQNPGRAIKIEENKDSYLWDRLLEKAFLCMMNGTLRSISHGDYQTQALLFYCFAKPCRVERRELARAFIGSYLSAIYNLDMHGSVPETFVRRITMNPGQDTLLTILWVYCPSNKSEEECLSFRRLCLESKMLAVLPQSRHYQYHIGIAKFADIQRDNSEDFIFLEAANFPDDCIEIREAVEFLNSASISKGRTAKNIYTEEYSSNVRVESIDYPW